jgi:exodeoxyribonuclease VII small subunit
MSNENIEESSFEASLAELENLVERMESGDLSLDESLQAFERGVSLTRDCQKALHAAEQRVEILTAGSTADATEPFDDDA